MEPKDFGRVIWRRKSTVVTAIIIVVASVFFASLKKSPLYVAECEVLFEAVGTDPADRNSPIIEKYGTLESNANIIGGPGIAQRVATSLDIPYAVVAGKVNVKVIPETSIFKVQVVDAPTPKELAAWSKLQSFPDGELAPMGHRAGVICNTIGEEYAKTKRDFAREYFTHQLAQLNSVSAGTRADLLKVLKKLVSARDSGDEDLELLYTNDRNNLVKSLGEYTSKISAIDNFLDFGIKEGGGEVTKPSAGGVAAGANHKRDGAMGLIVGLLFGVGIALLREYLDDTVKDKESTQRELGLPVLATLPATDDIDGLEEPSTGTIEAARNLRATLASLGFPHEKRTLVITSSLAKRRATTLASLAAAVAESGRSVLVIGSDLRGGRTHEVFGIANTVGLANVVRGQVPFEKAVRPAPGMDGVYVLPCGPIIGNPGELLSSEAMAMTLRRARRWADVVLLDAPPVLAAADSSILGAYADGVVLVVSAGQTNRGQANEAKEQLIAAGARVLGAVLVGSDEGTQHDDYGDDLGGFGGWGGGGYDAAYDPYATMGDEWYDDGSMTMTAYAEPRAPRPRSGPAKKTAASRAGQKPAPKREASLPRNGVRTTAGSRSSGSRASASRASTAKRAPAKRPSPARRATTTTAKRRSTTVRATTTRRR